MVSVKRVRCLLLNIYNVTVNVKMETVNMHRELPVVLRTGLPVIRPKAFLNGSAKRFDVLILYHCRLETLGFLLTSFPLSQL